MYFKIFFIITAIPFLFIYSYGAKFDNIQHDKEQDSAKINSILDIAISSEFIIAVCNCKEKGYLTKKWSLSTEKVDILIGFKINQMRISHDGKLLWLNAFEDSTISGVFSIEDNKWKWKHKGFLFNNDAAFSENDSILVIADDDTVKFFEVETGRKIESKSLFDNGLAGYTESMKRVVRQKLDPTGRRLIIWNEATRNEWGLNFIFIFSPSPNPNIAVWDIQENKILSEISKPKSEITSITFSGDAKIVFISTLDNKISAWSIEENKIIWEFSGSRYRVEASRDKTLLGVGESHLTIWDYSKRILIKDFGAIGYKFVTGSSWCFSNDGKLLAFEKEGILYLYETNTWQVLWSFPTCP